VHACHHCGINKLALYSSNDTSRCNYVRGLTKLRLFLNEDTEEAKRDSRLWFMVM